jgi:uncharacterized protein
MPLTLHLLPGELTIVRLPSASPIPSWLPLSASPLTSVTLTSDELSIICPSSIVPEGLTSQPGYLALRIEDKLDFSAVGILSSILNPLAAAAINILSVSTFDTDYILIPSTKRDQALAALRPHFQIP